jgi:hemolysin activation/secretion protein
MELQVFGDKEYAFGGWTRSWTTATMISPVKLVIDRGSLRYNHDFGRGYSFNSSFSWQAAPIKSLPSSEQFFIGGDGSVVGYTVASESGYGGQLLDLELHHPLTVRSLGSQKVIATGVLSLDYGAVTPFLPPGSGLTTHNHLAGAGWGVNAAIGKRYNARVSYGFGLGNGASYLRDRICMFQLTANAF